MVALTGAQRAAALAALGLSPDARPDEVTAAYRRLARALHPDATGRVDADAAAEFVAVSDAYHLLAGNRPEPTPPAGRVAPRARPAARVAYPAQDFPIVAGPVVVTPPSGGPPRTRRAE